MAIGGELAFENKLFPTHLPRRWDVFADIPFTDTTLGFIENRMRICPAARRKRWCPNRLWLRTRKRNISKSLEAAIVS